MRPSDYVRDMRKFEMDGAESRGVDCVEHFVLGAACEVEVWDLSPKGRQRASCCNLSERAVCCVQQGPVTQIIHVASKNVT